MEQKNYRILCTCGFVFWIHFTPSLSHYGEEIAFVQFFSFLFGQTLNKIAVPLFFILAGATFYRDYTDSKYKEKLTKRIKSLVIPYIIWNTLNMLFTFFTSTFFSQFYTNREKVVISLPNILTGIFYHNYNGPFWFIFALIVLTVVAPLIDKLLYSKVTAITALIIFILFIPESFSYTKCSVIFYLFGGLIGRFYFEKFTEPVSKKIQILSTGAVILALLYFLALHYKVLPLNDIVHNCLLILFSLCFWNMFDLFLSNDIIASDFTKHSFWIYAMHVNLASVITKVVYLLLPKSPWVCTVNFLITTVITLVCIEIICFIVKKISPKLYGMLSGSR